jgi:lysophospholipase L1-like esterase
VSINKRHFLFTLIAFAVVFLLLESVTRIYQRHSTRAILAKWPVLALYPNIKNADEIFSSVLQDALGWSPYGHWEMRPGLRSRFYRTNALGFRGPETSLEKPAGRFRIVVLGGSSAWGFGCTADERTVPGRLQTLLRKLHPGLDLEVINAGQIGFGSTQELIYFHRQILPLEPDLVLLFDGYNDILADLTNPASGWPLHSDLLKSRFEDSFHPHPLRKDIVALFRQSRFLDLIMRLLSETIAGNRRGLIMPRVAPTATSENYLRNLRALARLAAPTPLWVALQPVPAFTQKPLAPEEQKILAEKEEIIPGYAKRIRETYRLMKFGLILTGARMVDLENALGTEPKLMFADECHFGDDAADRIAHEIANQWSEAKVIPESKTKSLKQS